MNEKITLWRDAPEQTDDGELLFVKFVCEEERLLLNEKITLWRGAPEQTDDGELLFVKFVCEEERLLLNEKNRAVARRTGANR